MAACTRILCAAALLVLIFSAVITAQPLATVELSGIIRDQASENTLICSRDANGNPDNTQCCGNPGNANGGAGFDVDFQGTYGGNKATTPAQWTDGVTKGFVLPTIGADRTPTLAYSGYTPTYTIRGPTSFYTFFHDTTYTVRIPYNITLTQVNHGSNTFGFDSGRFDAAAPVGGMFPIDGQGWGDYCEVFGTKHNFNFCFEGHTIFGYLGGETFMFSGDDDFWCFINDQLVIDLGNTHDRVNATISLDDLGLTIGGNYRMDFFYCERHTWGSNLALATSVGLYCPYTDWCGVCAGTGQSCCTAQIIQMYCDDGNLCTTDTCGVHADPSSGNPQGCSHTNITCPAPTDQCTNVYCDPKMGCSTSPVVCNDGNPCTADSCLPASGCSFQLTCDDGNVCTTDICTATGCVNTALTCDDGNACTANNCDQTTGCSNPLLPCGDPTDKCQIATCDKIGGCNVTTIPTQSCLCLTVTCDTSDACNPQVCNIDGKCVSKPVDCSDGNPCTIDTCSVVGGAATCSSVLKVCSNDSCHPSSCNTTTGACVAIPDTVTCNDGNPCTLDSLICLSFNHAECNHTQAGTSICDDKNPCTSDYCNATSTAASPCYHQNTTCTPNNTCLVPGPCDPTTGCTFLPYTCPGSGDYCIDMTCDVVAGCINTTRNCPVTDNGCYTATCDSVAKQCTQQKRANWGTQTGKGGVVCPLLYDKAAKAAAISAGVLAGIIIAAVVGAALIGIAAKKGYDFLQARSGGMGGVHGNPLYEQSATGGNNAMYS